jgi:hypothetical protein
VERVPVKKSVYGGRSPKNLATKQNSYVVAKNPQSWNEFRQREIGFTLLSPSKPKVSFCH